MFRCYPGGVERMCGRPAQRERTKSFGSGLIAHLVTRQRSMTDSFPPASQHSSPIGTGSPRAAILGLLRAMLYMGLVAAVSMICYAQYETIQAKSVLQRSQ